MARGGGRVRTNVFCHRPGSWVASSMHEGSKSWWTDFPSSKEPIGSGHDTCLLLDSGLDVARRWKEARHPELAGNGGCARRRGGRPLLRQNRSVPSRFYIRQSAGRATDPAGQSARGMDAAVEFDVTYLEKKMGRSNSGDKKIIFGTVLCNFHIGLMKSGRVQWQEAEATKIDFNTVLIRQDKKFFTSEFFKVTQDAIPLILHYKTIYTYFILIPKNFFEYIYHFWITNSGLITKIRKNLI